MAKRVVTVPENITEYPFAYDNPDASRKGELAGQKLLFGRWKRYAVAPIHTRFGTLSWFVWDADKPDSEGKPDVIRQEDTFEAAITGLC